MRYGWIVCVAALGCGKKEEKVETKPTPAAEAKPDETKPAEAPPAPKADDTSFGTCRVVVSGAVTADETSAHTGPMVLGVYQWMTPDQRKTIGYPDEGLILNCGLSGSAKVSILTKKDVKFPKAAGTYKIGGDDGQVSVMGSLKHPDEEVSILQTTGTLEITAFDDAHIAGRASFTSKTVPDKGEAKFDVTFDMKKR